MNSITQPYIVLDIETNGLKPTKIFVVCVKDSLQKSIRCFTEDKAHDFKRWMDKRPDHLLIGHNISEFDLPAINVIWHQIHKHEVVDTLKLSRKIAKDLPGGHSLEVWGIRLCMHKGDFKDFKRLSNKMILYCKNDVKITDKLYTLLTR